MSETTAEVRKRAWMTRRQKYGKCGHSGSYGMAKLHYTAPWHARLQSMQAMLIRLYREGILSEGQVSRATGLDRVSCRELAIEQENPRSEAQ